MKTFLLIALLTASAAAHAQFNCDDNYFERTFTITGGAPFSASIEGGVQFRTFGGSIGIKSYETTSIQKDGKIQGGNNLTVFARGIVKVADGFKLRHSFTAYYGPGVMGASYRLGIVVDPYVIILAEPGYSKEQGKFINLGVTMNF